jgi:PAS domain S-box-containing protein
MKRYFDNNNFFGKILDILPHGIYVVNQQYNICYVNSVLKKEFGPVNGKKCYKYFHNRESICSWCQNKTVFKGTPVRWEWFSEKADKFYDLFDLPFIADNGEICKFEIFVDITELKRANLELQSYKDELESKVEERVKELNCIYSINNLAITSNIRIDDILEQTLDLLSQAMFYPESTCAKIVNGEDVFLTDNFKDTPWKLSEKFTISCKKTGLIEICYLDEKPSMDIGPFLKEEKKLICAVAKQLEKIIKIASDKVKISNLAKLPSENPFPVYRISNKKEILYSNRAAKIFLNKLLKKKNSRLSLKINETAEKVFKFQKLSIIENPVGDSIFRFFFIPVKGMDYINIYSFDITAQKKAENKINEQNEKLDLIINNIPEVIYSAKPDKSGTILYISDRWEEWTGYSPDECYKNGGTWLKAIHEDDRDNASKNYENAIMNRKENISEYRLVNKKTGKIRYVYDHGNPIIGEDGTLKRYDGIVANITEYKKLENQVIYSQKMEAMSTLTRGMAHEFNNTGVCT